MSLLTVLQALEAPYPYPGAPEGLKTWWGSSLKNTKITGNLQGQQKSEQVKKRKFRQNFVETSPHIPIDLQASVFPL